MSSSRDDSGIVSGTVRRRRRRNRISQHVGADSLISFISQGKTDGAIIGRRERIRKKVAVDAYSTIVEGGIDGSFVGGV